MDLEQWLPPVSCGASCFRDDSVSKYLKLMGSIDGNLSLLSLPSALLCSLYVFSLFILTNTSGSMELYLHVLDEDTEAQRVWQAYPRHKAREWGTAPEGSRPLFLPSVCS